MDIEIVDIVKVSIPWKSITLEFEPEHILKAVVILATKPYIKFINWRPDIKPVRYAKTRLITGQEQVINVEKDLVVIA